MKIDVKEDDKGYVVKEWFANYALHTSDVTFDTAAPVMFGLFGDSLSAAVIRCGASCCARS